MAATKRKKPVKPVMKRISAAFGRLRAPNWVSLGLIVVTLGCAVVLVWLIYMTALDKETQAWGKAFLFILGALAAVATAVVSWQPGKCSPLKRLISPFGAGLVLTAVFGAFGTMTNALSLFAPRAATSADTDRIEVKVDRLTAMLKQRFPHDPPVLKGIAGRWGELDPACGVIWQFSIREDGDHAALVAEAVKRPPGAPPYRLTGEIVSARGDTLQIVAEEPAEARGNAATFVVNSATGRLAWDDRARNAGVEEYRPCP